MTFMSSCLVIQTEYKEEYGMLWCIPFSLSRNKLKVTFEVDTGKSTLIEVPYRIY